MKEFYYLLSWSKELGWEIRTEDIYKPDTPVFNHDTGDWEKVNEVDDQQDSDNIEYLQEALNGQA